MTSRLFSDLMIFGPVNDESRAFFKACEEKFNAVSRKTQGFTLPLSKDPKIPLIVHVIWLGPRPYPEYALATLQEWVILNPEFQFYLWTDNQLLDSFPIAKVTIKYLEKDYQLKYLVKQYQMNTSYAAKSDILRLELLYEFGGFYTDYDNRCCKNLSIFAHSCELLGVFECEFSLKILPDPVSNEFIEPRVSNCIVGSIKKHESFKKIFEKIIRAHALFESISQKILIHQVIYATYVHFTLGVKDYVLNQGGDVLILPTLLGWRHYRKKCLFEKDYDPFFEINYLDSVGWHGERYDFMNFKNQILN